MGLQRLQPLRARSQVVGEGKLDFRTVHKLSNSQLKILIFKVSSYIRSAFENYAVWLDSFK